MSDKFWEGLGYVLGAILLVIAPPIWKVFKEKKYILWNNAKMRSEKEIDILINDIRSRLRVDRVEIFQYSNGDKTLSGVPFLFGNLTHEAKEPRLSSLKETFKKFPVSWFASILTPMLDSAVKSIQLNNQGYYINRDATFYPDRNAGILLDGSDMQSSLNIKFTQNVWDGVLAITCHTSDINITDGDYDMLLADCLTIWYYLKIKR